MTLRILLSTWGIETIDTGRGIADRAAPTPLRGEEIVRRLVTRELVNLVENDALARSSHFRNAESIHQLRVSSRRLRAKLDVVGVLLRRPPCQAMEARLSKVGASLGELRNLAVLDDLFAKVLETSHSPTIIHGRLEQDLDTARHRARGMLDSATYRHLIELLAGWAIVPPLRKRAPRDAAQVLAPRLWTITERLFEQVDSFGPQPTFDQLHHVRKLAKRGRYNFEVASWYVDKSADQVASAFEEVQRTLGDLHDRSVAVQYLEDHSLDINGVGDSLRASMSPLLSQWQTPLGRARQLSEQLRADHASLRLTT